VWCINVQIGDLFDVIEVSGAWVWVTSKGQEGRVMVSSLDLQLFDDEVCVMSHKHRLVNVHYLWASLFCHSCY
jgi:hypothetical protein